MRFRKINLRSISLFLTMACMTSSITSGQSTYQSPPVEIVDIIDIKPEPAISFSPDSNWMLLVDRDSMPDIADVARRMVALAGNRIDPVANGAFRTDFNRGISLRPRDGRSAIRIPLQDPSRVGTVSWSHDSKSFVYTLVTDNGTEQSIETHSIDRSFEHCAPVV